MGIDALNRARRSINSISTPSAQIANLCDVGTIAESLEAIFVTTIAKVRSYDQSLALVIWLMYASGLRISEILKIKGTDISRSYNILVRGSKKSNDRLVNGVLFEEFLKAYIGKSTLVFSQFDRFYIYRELKKLGLCYKFAGNEKSSVTHLGRHVFALQGKEIADESMTVGKMLGHKGMSSEKYYTKDE